MVTVFFIYQIEEVRAAKQSRFRSYKAIKEKERQVVVLPVLAGVVSGFPGEEAIGFWPSDSGNSKLSWGKVHNRVHSC